MLFEALEGQSCPCDSHTLGSSRFSYHKSYCCDFPTQLGKHCLTNSKGKTAAQGWPRTEGFLWSLTESSLTLSQDFLSRVPNIWPSCGKCWLALFLTLSPLHAKCLRQSGLVSYAFFCSF